MLLYPPPPRLSSSRSRHSIVVLNSYDDDPNILNTFLFVSSSLSESFLNPLPLFTELLFVSSHLTAFHVANGDGLGVRWPCYETHLLVCHLIAFTLLSRSLFFSRLINGFSVWLRILTQNWNWFYWKISRGKKVTRKRKQRKKKLSSWSANWWGFRVKFNFQLFPSPCGVWRCRVTLWRTSFSEHFRWVFVAKCARWKTSGRRMLIREAHRVSKRKQGSAASYRVILERIFYQTFAWLF